jgi:predicted small integral membrane protein
MAWTWQTALFFALLLATLCAMTVLALRRPETERVGALGLPTARGDRLFLTLLGAAFIHLGWLALAGEAPLWGASILSLIWGAALFRWA